MLKESALRSSAFTMIYKVIIVTESVDIVRRPLHIPLY